MCRHKKAVYELNLPKMGSATSLVGLTEGWLSSQTHIFSPPLTDTGQANGALYVHKLYPTLPNLDGRGGQSVWVGTRTCSHSMCQSILHLCNPGNLKIQLDLSLTLSGSHYDITTGAVLQLPVPSKVQDQVAFQFHTMQKPFRLEPDGFMPNKVCCPQERNAISCLLHFQPVYQPMAWIMAGGV